MNATASTKKSTTSQTSWSVLVALVLLISLMISCADRPQVFYTGQDYLRLSRGETYTATRLQETWASEAVIQEKDRTILELIAAIRKLQADLDLRSTP